MLRILNALFPAIKGPELSDDTLSLIAENQFQTIEALREERQLLLYRLEELQALLIGTVQKHGLSVHFTGDEDINGYTVFVVNDQDGPGFRLALVNEKVHGHA